MSVRILTIKISQWAHENLCCYRKNKDLSLSSELQGIYSKSSHSFVARSVAWQPLKNITSIKVNNKLPPLSSIKTIPLVLQVQMRVSFDAKVLICPCTSKQHPQVSPQNATRTVSDLACCIVINRSLCLSRHMIS